MTDPATEREALRLFEALLDVPESERGAWLAAHVSDMPGLRSRIDAMRAADRMASFPTGGAVDTLEEEPPPERIGVYRIVEQIGRGGMGTVYRGERASGDFALSVAIKLIKPGLFSPALVERFQRERQTLASLAHPNIARLYDGGETASGSPYIVMELVDGLPLLEWAEQTQPSTKKRIGIVREICAGVGFAHSNLIVHRDLTPSNVIVTSGSVAKLIDFGIAKPADAPASVPQELSGNSLVSLSLTPGFAAPERQTSSEVTTAADIYSIGKLLERLIADRGGDVELRAIVTRATEHDPADRYPTVDALDADLAAWSAAMPVAAMGSGWRYRAGKFIRRYKLAVAAAFGVAALLITALGITIAANIRAEARFAQTRAIAKTLLFDTYDEVSRSPGSTLARAKLAATGLAYLDALTADGSVPLDLQVEAGRGYVRLAEVTGGGREGQLGKFEESNRLLAKAEAILKPAFAANPDSSALRDAYAALLVEQSGVNLINNTQPKKAREQAVKAQTLIAKVAQVDPDSARNYMIAVTNEGDSYTWSDEYAKARDVHKRGEAFADTLPQSIRMQPEFLAARAVNQRQFGEAIHKLKEIDTTRQMLDRSVETARIAVGKSPQNPGIARTLISTLWYRAVVHRTNYRDTEAKASIEEAVALARAQQARDPADVGGMKMFALAGEVYAQVLGDLERYSESYAIGREVIATHQNMVLLAGNAPGAFRSMTAALSTHAGNFYNGGDYAEACKIWRQTIDNWKALEKRGELTDTDRKNGLVYVTDVWTRGCTNGPPRAVG